MTSRIDDLLPDREGELQAALLDYDQFLEAGLSQEDASAVIRCEVGSRAAFEGLREVLDILESIWPRGASNDKSDHSIADGDLLPLGTRIGRFRIMRQLGRGGFGVVYLAEDPQLRRQVAIKLPRPEILMTSELRRRFVREAHAAAALSHPHILPIFESGELGSICYLVSPYCSHGSLSEFLTRSDTPLTPRQAAHLILQLAEAIQYAHQAGILHRDLKPANVLIEPKDEPDQVGPDDLAFRTRIADFGLAQFLDRDAQGKNPAPGETIATKTGTMLGTPQYMAPEQINGDSRQIGPGVDIYGLGAVLYRTLTGQPPFSASGNIELLHQVVTKEPALPRSLRPCLPADLEAICLKCLEKTPAHRYHSARELADDLQRFLRGEATLARPLSRAQRFVRWSRQRPAAALAIASATLICVAMVSGLIFHSARVQDYAKQLDASLRRERIYARQVLQQRDVARERERDARQEAYVSLMSRALRMLEAGQTTPLCRLLQRVSPPSDGTDVRGFEWNYLWSIGAVHTGLRGSMHDFTDLCFSADSEYCLTWSCNTDLVEPAGNALEPAATPTIAAADPHVYVWHVPTRRLHSKLTCDGAPIAVAVLDAKRIKTVAGYGTIQTWDLASGRCLHSEPGPRLVPNCLRPYSVAEFSPDGRTLLYTTVVERDAWPANELRFWDIQGRTSHSAPQPWIGRFRFIRFSPDGQFFAVGGNGRDGGTTIHVHSIATRKEVARLSGEAAVRAGMINALPEDVAFFPQEQRLAISTRDGNLVTWHFGTGDTRQRQFEQRDPVLVSVVPNRKAIVAALWDSTVRRTQLQIFNEDLQSATLVPGTGEVTANEIRFSPDGKHLAYGGYSGQLRLLKWESKVAPFEVIGTHSSEAWGLAFSADRQWMVSGSDDHTVCLWDRRSGKLRRTLNGHSSLVSTTAFSPSGRLIASGSFDSTIRLWNSANGDAIRTLSGHEGQIRSLAFLSEDRLASVGADRLVHIWDLKTGQLVKSLGGHTDKIRAVVAHSKAGLFVTAGNDGAVMVWDTRELKRLRARSDDSEVQSLAISSNGRRLAAGSRRGIIWLYTLPGLELIETLEAREESARAVAFSADGRTVASGGVDGAVTLWNTATCQQMMTLPGVQSAVHSLAFSADGETLAAATHDGRITVWRAPPPAGEVLLSSSVTPE